MSQEPAWFEAYDVVVRLNQLIVEATGEDHVVLSQPLLESALARPKNLWAYEGIDDRVVLASRLMEAIGMNHCFLQGNERTAFHAGMNFLELNGISCDLPDVEANAALFEGVITGDRNADELVVALRRT